MIKNSCTGRSLTFVPFGQINGEFSRSNGEFSRPNGDFGEPLFKFVFANQFQTEFFKLPSGKPKHQQCSHLVIWKGWHNLFQTFWLNETTTTQTNLENS